MSTTARTITEDHKSKLLAGRRFYLKHGRSRAISEDGKTKLCTVCARWLPPSAFSSNSSTSDGRHYSCKSCHNNERKNLYWASPNSRTRWKRYGLTKKLKEMLLTQQGGVCAICGLSEKRLGRSLSLDHNHKCCPSETMCEECRRGFLCNKCNLLLGNCEDMPEILLAAIDYLNKWSKKNTE